MESIPWLTAGQALTIVIALIGAIGGIVELILHFVQMKRERLEIQRLERQAADNPSMDE